jgi:hypothetical protein
MDSVPSPPSSLITSSRVSHPLWAERGALVSRAHCAVAAIGHARETRARTASPRVWRPRPFVCVTAIRACGCRLHQTLGRHTRAYGNNRSRRAVVRHELAVQALRTHGKGMQTASTPSDRPANGVPPRGRRPRGTSQVAYLQQRFDGPDYPSR